MSPFSLLGGAANSLFGLGGNASRAQMDQARLRSLLEQQSANISDALRRQKAQAQQTHVDESDYIDAEFTVLDDQPQIEHAKLLEDKR